MEAYDTFLEKYPDYRGKVVLVMVAVPSAPKFQYMNLRERVTGGWAHQRQVWCDRLVSCLVHVSLCSVSHP